MLTFSLLIPETKGRSLEEMDVIFGTISKEEHAARVRDQEKVIDNEFVGGGHGHGETRSVESIEGKRSDV